MSRQILFSHGNIPAADTTWENAVVGNAVPLINAFDADNVGGGSLDLTEALDPAIKRIQFTQRPQVGETPVLTPVINVADVVNVKKTVYVAPAPQVTTVTPVEGIGEVRMTFTKLSTGFRPDETFSVVVDITELADAEAIGDAFRAAINGTKKNDFIAASGTTTLILTASLGVSFHTALKGAGWAIAATDTPNFGSGTFAQVKNLEEDSIARGGFYYQGGSLPVYPPRYADATKTYDLYVLEYKTTTTPNISKGHEYATVYLALQAGATGLDLEEVFNGVYEAPE